MKHLLFSKSGSALVLVLIAVLILSIIGISGLTHTGVSMATSRNLMYDKSAFYLADSGINYGLNQIFNTINPAQVNFFIAATGDNETYFRSGGIADTEAKSITAFRGFKPPPPKKISIEMSSELTATLTAWKLLVSSNVRMPKSSAGTIMKGRAVKELQAIVAVFVPEY
jgi:hypothetical protein